MVFGSVCSGIGAPEIAWQPLGWRCAFVSEIDRFPRAVLEHRLGAGSANGPRLFGDFTGITGADVDEPIDLLVGGTPCQSFSVAGKRLGLDDPRGNLALEYLALARRLRPRWLVFENVPGLLSSDDGRDFGAFLGLMGECGYGFAYRVLDAQFAGVPQRRRRVFVVGYLGDWRRAAAVLLEPESLRGDSPPRRETGERIAGAVSASPSTGRSPNEDATLIAAFGGNDTSGPIDVATARKAHGGPHGRLDFESETFIAHALRADGFDAREDGTGRGTPLIPVEQPYTLAIRGRGDSHDLEYRQDGTANAVLTPNGGRAGIGVGAICFSAKDHGADAGELSPTLRAGGHADSHANAGVMPAVAFVQNSRSEVREIGGDGAIVGALAADAGAQQQNYVQQGYAVRRLTPRECERLQGLPDDWTLIPYNGKPARDGNRYKAIGNSMAVPVVRWIGERIAMVERVMREEAAA